MKMVISYITTDYFEIKSEILNSVWLRSLLFVIVFWHFASLSLSLATSSAWWISGSRVCVIIINSLLNICNHMGHLSVCLCVSVCVCGCLIHSFFFISLWSLYRGSQSQFGAGWTLYTLFFSAVPRYLLGMCKLHNPDNEALLEKGVKGV